jgi:hypothetical protein
MGGSNFNKLTEFIVDQIDVNDDEVTPGARLYDDLGVYGKRQSHKYKVLTVT